MSAKPSSGLPTITVTSPTMLQTQPAGLVPVVTPLPGPPPTTASDAAVPSAVQVSELMVQATQDAVE
jgi:hypothetical protein